jgi:hypothetical protein
MEQHCSVWFVHSTHLSGNQRCLHLAHRGHVCVSYLYRALLNFFEIFPVLCTIKESNWNGYSLATERRERAGERETRS